MNSDEINDKRPINEFKGIGFSKYKKTEVIKQFLKSVNNGSIEEASYWSAELICAGHFIDLWDAIFLLVSDICSHSSTKPLSANTTFSFLFLLKNPFKCCG